MPCYYFDIDETTFDQEGANLPDLAAAKAYAAGLASTFTPSDVGVRRRRVTIRSETGEPIEAEQVAWQGATQDARSRLQAFE